MSEERRYPRRLIEVDFPIRDISAHARREKSIRHGHISTLHLWWARRPLAACRAVILGALLPDPADPLCPESFREVTSRELARLSDKIGSRQWDCTDPEAQRSALTAFIADFADWDRSRDVEFIRTSHALIEAAHSALGGIGVARPALVDPFAGGGAIPLEGLRCGAEVFASDLNPIPVVLNRVVLEYAPLYGMRLADAVREQGARLKEAAATELQRFYPNDSDGAVPIAYIWARTVRCEGPGCGCEIPLLRSMWLSKKQNNRVALGLNIESKSNSVSFSLLRGREVDSRQAERGTVARGAATCPACEFTMKVARVRAQLRKRRGGTNDARLIAVVTSKPGVSGRRYRLPDERDRDAVRKADAAAAGLRQQRGWNGIRIIPDEPTEHYHSFVNRGPIYGMLTWRDYFTPRQQLALGTMLGKIHYVAQTETDGKFARAVRTCVALALSRQVDATSSLCRWHTSGEKHTATFGRQALPMVWDFSEVNVLSEATGGFLGAVEWVARVCAENSPLPSGRAQTQLASAANHPLPDDAVDAVITDPPYYYSVQYADLADYFYVWLRRSLGAIYPDLFSSPLIEKGDEIIVQSPGHEFAEEGKNNAFYRREMGRAMAEARRILAPHGIAVVVFAHKSTSGWEAQLQSMVDAGWVITASWPIDTEMAARVIAQGRAVLASSVHLVCRPREHIDGRLAAELVGDWRAILEELPRRIHEWMPRLAEHGVVGADAIFSCLGPAVGVFSQYSRVEKVSGEVVPLREYLEQVWAAVAHEALTMIFEDSDTAGLEPDARLTAMWLWTLATSPNGQDASRGEDDIAGGAESKAPPSAGSSRFELEYDAARKIAQGLGTHLDDLQHVVEVKGKTSRLLGIAERIGHLFGQKHSWGEIGALSAGETTLDRIHQAMLLFAAGRGEALKRFLVEDAVGRQGQFWKLAQSLSALYPPGTDEKRWVDGVLAHNKGLSFA
ncbi:MAG: DUF1156 domain-containing protein [Proteobacteria bacterium]|nr:DUF1156 domain-containing protein [Pseudomonadota bacterium]